MKPEGSVTLCRWMFTPLLVIDGGTGYHGAFRLLLLLLLFHGGGLSLVAAQNATGKTESGGGSDAPTDQNDSHFDPTMAILMIVLISVFFFLGFFSVYIRQCLERAINGGGGDNNGGGQRVDPGSWLTLRPAGARGLDASVIETFPTFLYSTVKTLRIGGNKQALECPVCLNEFEDHETLRLIPKCCHVFHPGCIDAWLRSHSTCPLCRANLIPRPGETISLPIIPDPIPDPARETCRRSPSATPPDHRIRRGTLDSPDERLVNSMTWSNQSMPRRSMSTGWRLAGLFSRSNSLSGSPVVGNFERFTLRLPGEVHDQLVNRTSSYGGKGHVSLAQARSPTSGYRTERNYFYYERFDQEGQLDRRPFSITPPRWSGSLRSPDAVWYGGGGGSDQVSAGAPKGLLQAIRSPWDRLFIGKNNVGERSSDHLRSGYASHV